MSKPFTSPERLFDRTWRPGHPFKPRLGKFRRWTMIVLFLVLSLVISAYWYLTDSYRVRVMAETYLSELLGGHVTIDRATLSIFEGLRLDGVTLRAGKSDGPDDVIFTAQAFVVKHNPRTLLEGRLEAKEIFAIKPRLRLTEDLRTGRWNHQVIAEHFSKSPSHGSTNDKPASLPKIVLRNARVEYQQISAGKPRQVRFIDIDGQLWQPKPELDVYEFSLQSRGESEGVGPTVHGQLTTGTGELSASLLNFNFGPDIRAMLPAQVRQWCEEHGLVGKLDIPELTYKPNSRVDRPEFHVVVDLKAVTLAVDPQQWLSSDEIKSLESLRRGAPSMAVPGVGADPALSRLADLAQPAPIRLAKTSGRFIFDDKDGITIQDMTGHIESNGFKINGQIAGYSPSSPASITVSSLDTEDIIVPAAPRYVNSMPAAVREIYDHLRPQGRCSFSITLTRNDSGSPPLVSGEVNILDGTFVFDHFPYPIRAASGKLVFGHNPDTGMEQLEILNIQGHGVQGGPNSDATVQINGLVSPFGANTGVTITVRGSSIHSEPSLFAAFPKATQQALRLFDAPGHGEFPTFGGSFVCQVVRPIGLRQHWLVNTEINLDDAAGQMVAFPYAMSGVKGKLEVSDDHIRITNVRMQKGEASLRVNGSVSWDHHDDLDDDDPATLRARIARLESPNAVATSADKLPPLRTNLKIEARNVPIDQNLLNALPEDKRVWMSRLGVGGTFDLDGTIRPVDPPKINSTESNLDYDLNIALRDGSMRPGGGMFTLMGMSGSMRLTPDRLTLSNIAGKRNDADITARGTINWPNGLVSMVLAATAKNLALDGALHDALPLEAQRGWDQVQPKGTVDVALNYSGGASLAPATQPTTRPSSDSSNAGYEIVLTPRQLSVTPLAAPYRMDDVTGSVTILPDRVVMKDVAAKHGDSKLTLSGVGDLGDNWKWDFKLTGTGLPVDDDLRRAAPEALAQLLKSSDAHGTVGFDFAKLTIVPALGTATQPAATTQPSQTDVDFAVKISAASTTMGAGVPLSDINGLASFEGATHSGKLTRLDGLIDIASMKLAQRPMTNIKAHIVQSSDGELLQMPSLEAQLAGGMLAGKMEWAFGDRGNSRYALTLVLHDADVKQLTGETETDIRGRINASLSLQGRSDDPSSRRGRGDVRVTGERMMHLPLILGLLQVTNLALPITSPFSEASARYSVDGDRVTFESLELRAKEMLMQGNGHLDFGDKQVRMNFVTDNTSWPKLPVIGDLISGAQHELFKINVRGTLQDPKVSASPMNTLSTTVDEVFRGDARTADSK